MRLLTAIAGHVAAGIARAELYGRMTALAFHDGLTGLANRHALTERLELVLERGEARCCCATSTTSRRSTRAAATTAATGR